MHKPDVQLSQFTSCIYSICLWLYTVKVWTHITGSDCAHFSCALSFLFSNSSYTHRKQTQITMGIAIYMQTLMWEWWNTVGNLAACRRARLC